MITNFDYPQMLLAFAVFIPIILFDIFGSFRKKIKKLPKDLQKKIHTSVFLFRLFIVFSIIALACPRWGTGLAVSEYRRGLDAVFAIDVSRSMDIRDAQTSGIQSRLERGLSIAKDTVAAVNGARFAAAIGRSRGYLAVPLIWDNEAVLGFLYSLDASSMTGRSTNLEALVDAAANAFQISSAAQKVIILISDGEALAGVLRNAVNRCVNENIIIIAVATGSDEGRTIFAEADNPNSPAVISRRDAAAMRMAAERTGGIYIDASREDAALVLSSHLLSIAHDTSRGSSRSEPKERRTLFIILAILSYGASKFVTRNFSRSMPRLSFTNAAAVFAALFIFTSCSEGKLLLLEANYLHSRGRFDEALVSFLKALNFKDAAPYAEYGLGLTFYMLDESRAALIRYESSGKILDTLAAGEHRELRFRNNYNSGIIFFEEGEYRMAAAAFRDALRADPRRMEAKRNLELSLMSAARQAQDDNRSETPQENETRELLFEYIREKEQQIWRSREWAPEEKATGPDY
jgi:Ca-activated chloride channel family protein